MRITSPNNADVWRSGDNYAICDQCGLKFFRSEMEKQWDNLLVCDDCFEYRNPQDFVKAKRDRTSVADTRNGGDDNFLSSEVTPDDL